MYSVTWLPGFADKAGISEINTTGSKQELLVSDETQQQKANIQGSDNPLLQDRIT